MVKLFPLVVFGSLSAATLASAEVVYSAYGPGAGFFPDRGTELAPPHGFAWQLTPAAGGRVTEISIALMARQTPATGRVVLLANDPQFGAPGRWLGNWVVYAAPLGSASPVVVPVSQGPRIVGHQVYWLAVMADTGSPSNLVWGTTTDFNLLGVYANWDPHRRAWQQPGLPFGLPGGFSISVPSPPAVALLLGAAAFRHRHRRSEQRLSRG